jgi:hypothetical protein
MQSAPEERGSWATWGKVCGEGGGMGCSKCMSQAGYSRDGEMQQLCGQGVSNVRGGKTQGQAGCSLGGKKQQA